MEVISVVLSLRINCYNPIHPPVLRIALRFGISYGEAIRILDFYKPIGNHAFSTA